MQAYFWRANAQYFFAKCEAAILNSQSKEKEISAKGVVSPTPSLSIFTEIKQDGSALPNKAPKFHAIFSIKSFKKTPPSIVKTTQLSIAVSLYLLFFAVEKLITL